MSCQNCNKVGIAFASFNTRGHDTITSVKKVDQRSKKGYTRFPGGTGQEVFEQSAHDLEAMINFLVAPMSDRSLTFKETREVQKTIPLMQKLIRQGKGDVPTVGLYVYPITPKRYLSLLLPGMLEETFDYTEKDPKMTLFSKIKKPLLVIFAGSDEHARPDIEYIKKVFDSKATSPNYKGVILKNADHSFTGHEQELAKEITNWIKSLKEVS